MDNRKSFFFDREDWDDIFTPAELKMYNRIGFILMKQARSLIRRRKKPSRPGSSPTNWTGFLRDHGRFGIMYGVDVDNSSVWIGPGLMKTPGVKTFPQPTVPATLEFGGKVWNRDEVTTRRGRWLPAGRVVKIAPRPYMSKAYRQKEKKVLATMEDFLGSSEAAVATAHSKWRSKAS